MLKLHRQYVCIRNLNTQEIQEFKTREEALQPYSDRTKYTHTECGIEWLDNNFETCKDNEIRQGQKLTRLDSFIFVVSDKVSSKQA